MPASARRWSRPALHAAASLLAVAVAAPPGGLPGGALPAAAAPGAVASPTDPLPDGEGGTPILRDVLEATGREYLAARAALENSQRRQARLVAELDRLDRRIGELVPQVGAIATHAYRIGRVGPALLLLRSSSPDTLLERATGLDQISVWNDGRLRELDESRRRAARAKAAIDATVVEQRRQLAVMTRRKQEAERALALVGGVSTGGFVSVTSPVATPAPRNPDGSWAKQSCDQDDPTTKGCITPRLAHALAETWRAGFTRFVSCYRPGGPYEHPKGRACDFSAQRRGFGGDAAGDDKVYGNNLAAFLVRNADQLGVLYVIWYRQIWFPATGWKSYGDGHGDPSSDHTNHVHLSVL
ncbi:hypothetical protein AB0J86_19405 [Micromonospora sp. NPDC049559]|uniref:coiled-coil domain-containing protein n=1 Tax=Micromonospora sp. NPDC049559 TaxID=3155923 RepID=UPI003442D07C